MKKWTRRGFILVGVLALLCICQPVEAKRPTTHSTGGAVAKKQEKGLKSTLSKKTKLTLPDKYDGREQGYLVDVMDQGYMSWCWTFSSQGAIASTIKKQGILPSVTTAASPSALSQWQQVYWMYHLDFDTLGLSNDVSFNPGSTKKDLNQGGIPEALSQRYASWCGVAPQQVAPYSEFCKKEWDEDASLSDKTAYLGDSYHLRKAEIYGQNDSEGIKQAILEYGAGTMRVNASYCNEENETSWYQDENSNIDHDVMVVGWDDHYAVTHFDKDKRPSKEGAWLCQNSWGTSFGDKGFFWISYEDAVMNDKNTACFFQMEDASKYDNNYQYDLGTNTYFCEGYDKEANIFTSQYKETLKAVSIGSVFSGMDYTIKIYKNPEPGQPESGTQVGEAITGSTKTKGNYVINLEEAGGSNVELSPGERFSIVVKATRKSDQVSGVVTEVGLSFVDDSSIGVKCYANSGESFVKVAEENNWYDWGEGSDLNICIKGLTQIDKSVLADSLQFEKTSIDLRRNESAEISYQIAPANTTDTKVNWHSSDSSAVKAVNGKVTAVGTGSAIVTGEINGHMDQIIVNVIDIPTTDIMCDDEMVLDVHKWNAMNISIEPADTTDIVTYEFDTDTQMKLVCSDDQVYAIEPVTGGTLTITTQSGFKKEVMIRAVEKSPEQATVEDMQSAHPYLNNVDETWRYQRANAIGYYVTFDEETKTEKDCDYIKILDEKGEAASLYSGDELSGKTIYATGSSLQIQMATDDNTIDYGFRVTKIEPVYTQTPTPLPTPTLLPTPTALPTQAPMTPAPMTKKKLVLRKSQLCLALGKKLKVKANQTGVKYQVSPSKYAKISSTGVVTAKKAGVGKTITITGKKDGWLTAKTSVRIYKSPVKKIKKTSKKITGKSGKKIKLMKYFSVLPKKNTCKSVRYSISKEKYGKIKGNILHLTKSAKGKVVKVTIYAQDGSKKKISLSIHVN